jgi:Fic family protein
MNNRLTIRLQKIPNKELSSILTKIAKIDEFKGWWKGVGKLNPQALGRLKKSIVITSAGASTRIEGSHLSDKDVEKLLKGLKVSKLKDRDSQEVAGYADAISLVFDSYDNISFSEGVIFQFHKMMLKYSEKDKDQRGKYKATPNKVVAFDKDGNQSTIFNTTEPYLTPFEMKKLVEWTNSSLKSGDFHPVVVIANFILEFLAIHPFHDGNGRLSRVLTNLLLAKSGYIYMPYASLEKIIEDHKIEYYLALRNSQKNIKKEDNDISKWLHFFIDVMLRQIEVLRFLVENRSSEDLLSDNQKKVLGLFDKHDEITNKLINEKFKIPQVTAKQILNRLLELKLIRRVGAGRSVRYIINK